MIPTFVIFLREGIEAFLIVAILLAYLDKVGRRELFRDIFIGVALALVLAGLFGAIAYETIRTYAGSRVQTIFETSTYLLACSILTYMTFWMRKHSRAMSGELASRAGQAISGRGRLALSLLAFQSVGREGLETVVFTLAIMFAQSAHFALLGGFLGLITASGIALAIFKFGKKIDIGKFFSVVGIVLMFFAAGLLTDTVENLDQLGWLTILSHPLWNSTSFMSENSSIGDLFHTLIGYSDRPTVLQGIVYVIFVSVVSFIFIKKGPERIESLSISNPASLGASSP